MITDRNFVCDGDRSRALFDKQKARTPWGSQITGKSQSLLVMPSTANPRPVYLDHHPFGAMNKLLHTV